MNIARALWVRVEHVHAVTYFGDETTATARQLGLNGFWAGYFALRAAPMGAVRSGVVQASFFNFAPSFVDRWIPAVWSQTSPDACVSARCSAAAATLTRLVPGIESSALAVNPLLLRVVEETVTAGRVLCAANHQLALPAEPVAALWQLCTTVREHRGDGHVAALTAAGVDGLEAHVLIAAEQGTDPGDLQRTRGWSEQDWQAAIERCQQRGFLNEAYGLTVSGRQFRHDVEAITDRLALEPWRVHGEQLKESVFELLTPAAETISASGVIRYPNPMGLPPLPPDGEGGLQSRRRIST
jgi:hypothetical protein